MYQKSIVMAWSVTASLAFACAANSAGTAANLAAPSIAERVKLYDANAHWPEFTGGMWMPIGKSNNGSADDNKPGGLFSKTDASITAPVAAPRGSFLGGNEGMAFTAAAQAQLEEQRKHPTEGQFTNCLPPGPTNPAGFPLAFYYAGDSIFIISDMDDFLVRRVIMNRKDHGDPDPTWAGHSIGHWEGGTLVVDTTAIAADIELGGLPSGGNMHMVERIRLLNPNEIEWTTTVTDPEILAKPWVKTTNYRRHRDWEIEAASCTEGNRDVSSNGTAGVNLKDK